MMSLRHAPPSWCAWTAYAAGADKQHPTRPAVRFIGSTLLCALVAATPHLAAQTSGQPTVIMTDRAGLQKQLRKVGYRTRGGLQRSQSDSADPSYHALP